MKKIECISFKVTYHSKEEARESADQINKKGAEKNGEKVTMRFYHCSACGHWHLTSMKRSLHEKIKKTKLKMKEKRISQESEYWEKKLK